MKFREKLKKMSKQQLWDDYCGFLALKLSDYMYIQNRLMAEQIKLWSASGLGKKLLNGAEPKTIDEFRRAVPLTTYDDYASVLLRKDVSMLPGEPVTWIQTTWEGGLKPIKLAPYTRGMLDVYKHNAMTIMILAASTGDCEYDIKEGDTVLYGGAPLPYATGLLPSLMDEDVTLRWLPDTNEHSELSFSQRIKKGFEIAYKTDIKYIFGIGSVSNYITESFSKKGRSAPSGVTVSPRIAYRYMKAKYICRRDGRQMLPKDVFKIKGFVSTGTDASCYKEKLGKAWGKMPIEIAAGTESTCIGTETWEQNGMVLFPDACFYEFIPEEEMYKNINDPAYKPQTCLTDEVRKDRNYELVITVLKGGAFARYRIGDVYRCVSAGKTDALPRFEFVDRVPSVIDIAGFTRITEKSIAEVISMSKLGISAWIAKKEYTGDNCPYLRLYVEIDPRSAETDSVSKSILTEHLSVYFKHFDSDYDDLKKLLNIDPLQITVLKSGSIAARENELGHNIKRINPPELDIMPFAGARAENGRQVK